MEQPNNLQNSAQMNLEDLFGEELKCSICLEFFEDPRIGCPVGHTFCFECLKALAKKKGNQIECPLCRGIQKLDRYGVASLPRNIHVANVVEKLKTTKNLPYPYNLYAIQTVPTTVPKPSAPPLEENLVLPQVNNNNNNVNNANNNSVNNIPSAPIPIRSPEESNGLFTKISNFFWSKEELAQNPPLSSSPTNPVVSVQMPAQPPVNSPPVSNNNNSNNNESSNRGFFSLFGSSNNNSNISPPKQTNPSSPPPMQKFPIYYSQFQFDETKAKEKFIDWAKSLWFAPSNFSSTFKLKEIHAYYVPFWNYDLVSKCKYEGRLLHLEKNQNDNKNQAVEKWVLATGYCERIHKQYLYCNDDPFKGNLEPLYSLLLDFKDFDPAAHLSLHLLLQNNPKVLKECLESQAWLKVQGKLLKDEEDFGEEKLKRDNQAIRVENFRMTQVVFEKKSVTLVFIPVYFGIYEYEGYSYQFAINGQKGTIQGHRPYGLGMIGNAAKSGVQTINQLILNSLFGDQQ